MNEVFVTAVLMVIHTGADVDGASQLTEWSKQFVQTFPRVKGYYDDDDWSPPPEFSIGSRGTHEHLAFAKLAMENFSNEALTTITTLLVHQKRAVTSTTDITNYLGRILAPSASKTPLHMKSNGSSRFKYVITEVALQLQLRPGLADVLGSLVRGAAESNINLTAPGEYKPSSRLGCECGEGSCHAGSSVITARGTRQTVLPHFINQSPPYREQRTCRGGVR